MNPEKDNLRIPFAAIRRGGAKPREISITVQLDDLKVGLSKIIDGKVEVSLSLLLKGNEVEAEGFLYASWVGECRRCLEDVEGDLKLEIKERFVQEDKYLKKYCSTSFFHYVFVKQSYPSLFLKSEKNIIGTNLNPYLYSKQSIMDEIDNFSYD